MAAGEALGVVGESGSGKSTLARAALQLIRPESGRVVWLGRQVDALAQNALRPLRRDVQMIFQDPLASLDPRMTVGEIVAEPLQVHRPGARSRRRRRGGFASRWTWCGSIVSWRVAIRMSSVAANASELESPAPW